MGINRFRGHKEPGLSDLKVLVDLTCIKHHSNVIVILFLSCVARQKYRSKCVCVCVRTQDINSSSLHTLAVSKETPTPTSAMNLSRTQIIECLTAQTD